ncbi:MAG: leucine-rich repeat protein [Bacteroidaceae bacterium]|nr:leucine-rich repeat protein [Bacteroidaceae bacterium]
MQTASETSYFSTYTTSSPLTEQIRLEMASPTYIYYKVVRDGRCYFMKALHPELLAKEYYRETLRKEYELGHSLQCEYLVHYTQLVDTPDEAYVLMEYVNGHTLDDFVSQHPDYFADREHVRKFLRQLLLALRQLHTHQALHLDLKPSNIMLTSVNNDVRLIDLGCSYTDARPSTTGHTDHYAAPEQLDETGEYDARTDLYAVGRILNEIDNGHYADIAQRLMADDPNQRYTSADEVLALVDRPRHHHWPILLLLTLLLGGLAIWIFGYGAVWPGMYLTDCQNQDTLHLRILSLRHRTLAVVAPPQSCRAYADDVVLPDSVVHRGQTFHITEIAPRAFADCHQLENIHFPTTLTTIRKGAFDHCCRLTALQLPPSLTQVEMEVFHNCRSLSLVSWPPSCTEVPRNCFLSCVALRSITLPEGVTAIHQDAFVGCDSLTDVQLPQSLTAIERGVFYACPALRDITIPVHVTLLGEYLFYECPSLQAIRLLPTTPPYMSTIVDKHFEGTILVPSASLEAYRTAPGWKNLKIEADY